VEITEEKMAFQKEGKCLLRHRFLKKHGIYKVSTCCGIRNVESRQE
jgi:hypothetical protein